MSLVDRALAELRATIAPRQSVEPVQGMTPEAAYSVGLPDGVGLYVHVPFCEALCRFCPYNKVRLEAGRTDRYVHALRREVALLTPLLRKARPGSLYFGGGTPTLLPSLVEEIIGRAQDFGLRGEVATEVHPRHASPPLLTRLRQAGVSYVSVGVQSFDDRVLSYLGRDHDAQGAIRGLEAALAAGFACVDADLMFDVVRFGEDRVVQDAEIAFSLGVDQLSVYPMMRFDGDPQHDEPAEKRALQRIAQAGGKLGYARTSVWTFGKNPKHRYSSITRDRYVGLGPSGSSLVDGGQFYVNTFDVDTYAQLTDSGRLPIAAHIDLAPHAAVLYDLFWRCYEGYIDSRRFSDFQAPLMLLRLAGVLRQHGMGYQLTERGFDLFHTVERQVTYAYIKPLWAACRAKPIPAQISL